MTTFWTDRRVLVTGATGFLGSELVAQLIPLRASVVTIVRDYVARSRFNNEMLGSGCDIVFGDVTDAAFVSRTIIEYEIDTVFHLAAQSIVGIASASPASSYVSNVMGTVNVLEGARRAGRMVRRVIVASSDKAYGELALGGCYRETDALRPKWPYDTSKACADLITRSYALSFNMDAMVVRCGNLHGPGDLNFNRIVPRTIRRILRGLRPQIYGDGMTVRDMTHVSDAARAYILLGEPPGAGELAVNVSGGDVLTVREIVDLIAERMHWTGGIEFLHGVPTGIPEQRLDCTRIRSFGWYPRHDLESTIGQTIDYYRRVLDAEPVPELRIARPEENGDDPEPADIPEAGCVGTARP